MVYLTLVATGAIFSFCLEKSQFNSALLVLPVICNILGWTYLRNDEKVNHIGYYLKQSLLPKIAGLLEDDPKPSLENWETHREQYNRRPTKKSTQLFFDILLFCATGLAAVILFAFIHPEINLYHTIVIICELLLTLRVGIEFYFIYQSESSPTVGTHP
jgi:hypothetical protein